MNILKVLNEFQYIECDAGVRTGHTNTHTAVDDNPNERESQWSMVIMCGVHAAQYSCVYRLDFASGRRHRHRRSQSVDAHRSVPKGHCVWALCGCVYLPLDFEFT